MNINYSDPAILIPAGVLLIGIVAFFWAVGRLLKKSPSPEGEFGELPSLSPGDDLLSPPAQPYTEPPISEYTQSSRNVTPAASKEMVERLDGMTQKLSDMQSVLQRQSAAGPGGAPLNPETIDKLLKIIGNVTQQVDLLQRSLGAPASTSGSSAPKPKMATPPTGSTPTASPSGQGIGLMGGALSRFPKPGAAPTGTPPIAKPTPGSDTPPPANPPAK